MEGCEHGEGSPMGKCAICARTVCSECFRNVFTEMICDGHQHLEDESEWVLVGFYLDGEALKQRRYLLDESGITSLAVDGDEDAIELYVPTGEKDDAQASLSTIAQDALFCGECRIQFSTDMGVCPLCGVKPASDESNHVH